MYVEPGLFYRFDPVVSPVPLLVDVSRSGREYPTHYRSPVAFSVLHDNVSMYVDEIWKEAPFLGGTLVQALVPHVYIDMNRHELDLDENLIEGTWPVPLEPNASKRGLGLLKSVSRYGEPMQERKLTVDEIMFRMNNYHRPYHKELKSNVDRLLAANGFLYHLSCHCMSAIGAPTHPDAGKVRADFCLGNGNGKTSSPEFIEFVAKTIRDLGFTCAINDPYPGGEINRRYGDPENGVESLLMEINKKCFMDVKTFEKNEGFDRIQKAATAIMAAIAARARAKLANAIAA